MNTLTLEDIERMQDNFETETRNRIAQYAVMNNGIMQASENKNVANKNDFIFSIDIDSEAVENQNQSGRCWMYACLNTLRYHIGKKYDVKDPDLSQNYTFFWDKLEKANYFYANIIDTANKPVSDREVQYFLATPQQDGGDWNLIVSIIKKYGVVPKILMPETYASKDSSELNTILNRKLRQDAIELRNLVEQKKSDAYINQVVQDKLQEVYRILSMALGTPPKKVDFSFRTKKNEYKHIGNITPLTFFNEYIDVDLENYVGVINIPLKEMPFNTVYGVEKSGNMVDGIPNRYLNLDIDTFKQLAIKQLSEGEPVWFGCDVLKAFNRKQGVMAHNLYDLEDLLDVKFTMDKGERFKYKESLPTHAMVLAGVDLLDNKPVKWKVENSWGSAIGDYGYMVMDDKWMDEYTFEVAIRKDLLSKEQQEALEKDPVILPFWNGMNPI